jgi:hypothetical protein
MLTTTQYIKSLGIESSIQDYINSVDADLDGKNGYMDIDKFNDILGNNMLPNGWEEVNINELSSDDFSGKVQLRYIRIEDDGRLKFRSGGFFRYLYTIGSNKLVVDKDTGEQKVVDEPFILYQPHWKTKDERPNVILQFSRIHRLFLKRLSEPAAVAKKQSGVKFKRPTNKTNFPVCMVNNEGNVETVYFARDEYARKRFMNSKKFERAKKDGWEFE